MAKDLLALDFDDITMADLDDEPEHVEAEMLDSVEDFEEMTLSIQEKNKKALSSLKQKVMLTLDEKKLKEAQKILISAENIGGLFSDPEILEKVKENTKSAMDLKFLSDAYAKLLDTQQKLMRLDSVDGQGTAGALTLDVKLEGAKVTTIIKTE